MRGHHLARRLLLQLETLSSTLMFSASEGDCVRHTQLERSRCKLASSWLLPPKADLPKPANCPPLSGLVFTFTFSDIIMSCLHVCSSTLLSQPESIYNPAPSPAVEKHTAAFTCMPHRTCQVICLFLFVSLSLLLHQLSITVNLSCIIAPDRSVSLSLKPYVESFLLTTSLTVMCGIKTNWK